ncbi:MAG: DUF4295 domain-containing protein [Fidelibacterota bacterium]|nr:MAG: DUF4295 domain-containing protein [Candidatus Neomarinimicrobiota bacterium]
MSKGQTSFAEKARKAAQRKSDMRHVRVVKSVENPATGAIRFSDRMVAVPSDVDIDEFLKETEAQES